MNQKKSGWLYLVVIVSLLAGSHGLRFLYAKVPGFSVSTRFSLMYGELLMLIPTLVFLAILNEDVSESMRIHKVKLTTLLLTVPFIYLIMPLMAMCNALTMLVTDNIVASVQDSIVSDKFIVMFFIIAVFGPFVEEAVFRGAIYYGLRKSRRLKAAIFIQAVMFGLMHMNLNQFLYAFVIGLFLGVLSEITGSILPSFLGHMIINGSTTFSIFSYKEALAESADLTLTKGEILTVFFLYAGVSIITTFIAVIILRVIAKNEPGGMLRLKAIFRREPVFEIDREGIRVDARTRIWSIPAMLAMLVSTLIVLLKI